MAKLARGKIYRIRYTEYKHDPLPLILVLYADKNKIHALNINYLSTRLTDQLITVIADAATKRINSDNAYTFYHRHLKKVIPTVIKYCYRTYFTSKVRNQQLISDGFDRNINFLRAIKSQFTDKEYKSIKKEIKIAIKESNNPETQKKQIKRMFRMFREGEKFSNKELEKRVLLYLEHINNIKIKTPKIDWGEFTFNK